MTCQDLIDRRSFYIIIPALISLTVQCGRVMVVVPVAALLLLETKHTQKECSPQAAYRLFNMVPLDH